MTTVKNKQIILCSNIRAIVFICACCVIFYVIEYRASNCVLTDISLKNNDIHSIKWQNYSKFRNTCRQHVSFSTPSVDVDFVHKAIHIATSHCIGSTSANLTKRQQIRTDDALNMIKSAVFMTTSLLHIHVITDQKRHLLKQINSWPKSIWSRVRITFYNPCFPAIELKAVFRLCSVQRLFIPYILDSIDQVIYTDSDSLFIGPVDDVWSIFDKFLPQHILGMTAEILSTSGWYEGPGEHIPHLKPHGYNAGVLLMKLKNMRNKLWYDDMYTIVKRQDLIGTGKTTLGDQDYLNDYMYAHREQLYKLPCSVNYRSDFRTFDDNNNKEVEDCQHALQHGISLLHGNRNLFHKPSTFAILFNTIAQINWNNSYKDYISLVKNSLKKSKEVFPHIFYKRLEGYAYGSVPSVS